MKTFRTFCPQMSDALQAMYDGLIEQGKRGPDYGIHMREYVIKIDDVCFACAATCAIQKATGFTIEPDMVNEGRDDLTFVDFVDELKISKGDISDVEEYLDSFREGIPSDLLEYYEVDVDELPVKLVESMKDVYLSTANWENEIKDLLPIIQGLKELGL